MLFRRIYLILVLVVVMEILAAFPVVVGSSLLDAASAGYAVFWLLLLAGLGGLAVSRLLLAAKLPLLWSRIILVSAAPVLVVLPGLIRADSGVSSLVTIFLLALAYWRGTVAAQEDGNYNDVLRRFGLGFVFVFFGLTMVAARGIIYDQPVWRMLALVGIGFTVVAMIGLGVARMERQREPGALRAVVMALVVQLGLVGLLALIALQVFALDITGAFFDATRPVWDVVGHAWYGLITLIATPIDHLISLIKPHGHTNVPRSLPHAPADNFHGKKPKRHKPADNELVVSIGLAIALVVLLAVAALIWRTLQGVARYRPERKMSEERAGLMSAGQFWTALLAWLRGLFGQSTLLAEEMILRAVHRIRPVYPVDPVRRVYTQLLRRAAAAGTPRPISVTPLEYQQRLVSRWPDNARDIAGLTDAYEQRRYGETVQSPEEIALAQAQWHRLRAVILAERVRAPEPDPSTAVAEREVASARARFGPLGRFRRRPDLGRESIASVMKQDAGTLALLLALPILILLIILVVFVLVGGLFGGGTGAWMVTQAMIAAMLTR